ncbi:MAG TPA: pitrilysin family protein [Candidatus Dormibacteraeota bacterium]
MTFVEAPLPGGARLVTVPLPGRASVAVSLLVGVGSRYEAAADSGISHFVEHMVFKGGRRYPTARAISEAIEGVGGVLNAATDRESTVFWTRVPATSLPLAAAVLTDMVLYPAFDPAEVIKERQVVIEELRMYEDNPQEYAQIVFDEVMWPEHPLGRDVAGTEATVTSFTAEDCRAHLDRYVRPSRVVVSVAGAVDPDAAHRLFSAELEEWAARDQRPEARPAPPASPPDGPRLRIARRATEQATVLVGARSASYLDPERYAEDILNAILGEGMSSRLFLELREQRGCVYDVHSFVTRFRDSGATTIGLGCEPKRAVTALRAALAELRRLAGELVGDAEMLKAREFVKGRLLLSLESTSALGEYAGHQLLLTGTILDPAEIIAQLEAVSAEDVRRAARRVLDEGLRGAVVGPFRSSTRFEGLLR